MTVAASSTRILAEFVATTRWTDIPRAVRHEARRSLVNYFAVALAGAVDPTIAKALAVYGRFDAGGDAGVIGHAGRRDILNAAALNAMSANVFDFDDTHLPTIIHPTAPVAAALFALAQAGPGALCGHARQVLPITGERFLLAFVLGVEVACRLGNAVPGHYQRGWHITSTCGVVGAAAGTARALGLDALRTAWAFGNAVVQAGGLVEALGTMSKSISVGNAARNGLLSALLAAEDFSGPAQPLEGERGFLRVTSEHPDAAALTRGLGEDWALLSNTYKPYPCGVVLNPVIEACLALSGELGELHVALDDIDAIELVGHPLLRERTDRPDVQTGRAAQVSAQHAVAVALTRGRAGLAEFNDACVAEPALRALGRRLRFVDDPAYPVEAARITLVLRSGATVSRQIDAARGSLTVPLSDADLEAKLRALAAYGNASCDTDALLRTLWTFDAAPDAALPMRMSGVAARAAPADPLPAVRSDPYSNT
ncbi:MAG: MmgE/PrpD family protein [Janthinobacterium lividum]